MKKPKISIGIEIEVNQTNGLAVDGTLWTLDTEHCGFELRSFPCKSPGQIKSLIKSIEKMGKDCYATFENTGTHIHIDFLNDKNVSPSDLSRLQVPKNKEGDWNNPFQSGKRYVWTCNEGQIWKSPKAYIKAKKIKLRPSLRYSSEGRYVESVKRFMLIGVRFADVLFAMQHPSRRFNKYCHTLSGWDEQTLMTCKTVREICENSRLLQNHRRHMFNPLSFQKFGTVEIRMIKGMLDHEEIWQQIFLFGKLAQLAKSNDYIPNSVGSDVALDFLLLMNACKIHGKMRRKLKALFIKNKADKNWTARCFHCEDKLQADEFHDYGLSRPYCARCHLSYTPCVACGYNQCRGDGHEIDDKMGTRYLCYSCESSRTKKKIKNDEKNGMLYILGSRIGSGIDDTGPTALRRMREVFK